jgi:hypothetical protein
MATTKKAAGKAPAKRFRVKLEEHEGMETLSFVVPFDVREAFGSRGRVPVRGTINGFPFRSSIFPVGDGTHYMAVNRAMREGGKLKGGDTVTVTLEPDTEQRAVTPPADLARALKANKDAQATWDKLSYTHQKEYARSVEEAKRPETRRRRTEEAIEQLAAGKKGPRG